jgi:predicted nucleic acid-binding protein
VIILDTNVVSEPFRPHPDLRVRNWIDAQPANTLFICAPVLAELHFGLERLAAGARKDRLRTNIERIENDLYRGRILPLDAAAAAEYGRLVVKRERMGRPIKQMDALIAAIALTHGAVLATRDVDDFANLGLDVINPFESSASAS